MYVIIRNIWMAYRPPLLPKFSSSFLPNAINIVENVGVDRVVYTPSNMNTR
jgi:hypothetical protein